MQNLIMTIYAAILFFILTPNVLVSLPPKGSVLVVAMVHAIIFGIVFNFTKKPLYNFFYGNTKCENKK